VDKIFAKQLDAETYCLVNEYGHSVGLDGELAYHPYFYNGQAKDSGYPEYLPNKAVNDG